MIIRNVVSEEIDRVDGVHDLIGADLRGKQWEHADLRGLCLFGANLSGARLFGARLERVNFSKANLRGADLSYTKAEGADFSQADLRGASFAWAAIGWPHHHGAIAAEFRGAITDSKTILQRHKLECVWGRPARKATTDPPRRIRQRGMGRRRSRFPKREVQCSN